MRGPLATTDLPRTDPAVTIQARSEVCGVLRWRHAVRSAVLILFSLLTLSVPAAAQLPVPGPASSVLFGNRQGGPLKPTLAVEPRDTLPRQSWPTYWKEGALIGGALGAIGGAVLAHRLCGLAEESTKHCTGSSVLGGVLGAALVAIPGALIGGQFSKEPTEPDPSD
jgi:hypothetical protein